MSELSKIEADDDVTQAYLLFKKKDYKACLQIFEENFADKENISVQHNQCIVSFLADDNHEYESLYKQLDELLNKISSQSSEKNNTSNTIKAIITYNMAVLLSLQQNYEECEKLLQKLLSDSKITDNSILLRCNLLLIEIYLSLYCIKGETKEWLLQKCVSVFSQTEMILSKDTFPDYIKNRLLFRYHIYRTLYFLEQGSVKGVKKEVKSSTDYYLLFSNESQEDYIDHIRSTVHSSAMALNLSLDSFETVTAIDGYLPPILKTRLEFRRGNYMKILSVLNQVYESDGNEDASIIPSKDCFYYSMLSGVFYSGNMIAMSKHYLLQAIQKGQEEHVDSRILGSLLKNLSLVCISLHEYEEAIQASQQAIQFLPENPTLWFRYGEICYTWYNQQQLQAQTSNRFIIIQDSLSQSSINNQSSQNLFYLKEALMAFSTVIEIYSQRNESTSSVYFAALSRKALILLTMGEYKQCIEMCSTTIETLHSASSYDDDDLPKTKEEIEFALVLYMTECQMSLCQYDIAYEYLNPQSHPDYYPPLFCEIVKDPSVLTEKESEIEKVIDDWSKPYLETFVYNLTYISICTKNWKDAEVYADLLMFFKSSLKNAKLRIYMYLQKGEKEKAKQFYNEYMIKC